MELKTIGMLAVIAIYLIMMVVIGVIYSKKNNDVSDFYLGGRKLSVRLVTAMSAEASDMSSWLLMGLPGVAYLSGVADAGWTAIGLGIGTYLNWLFVAKRLRRYSVKAGNAITIPEFFSNRFRDNSHLLLAISAIWIVIFFVPYTASGFAACGKLFSTLFNIPYLSCHDRQCDRYCSIYSTRRILSSQYNRSDPEYRYDDRTCDRCVLRRVHGRWLRRGNKQCKGISRIFKSDTDP